MIETITGAAKLKVLIAVFSLLVLGGVYSSTATQGTFAAGEENEVAATDGNYDPFTQDIQARSDLVYNAVMEAVNQQGKQAPLTYKQNCENSISFIQSERLDTNTHYNELAGNQKALVQDYRAYLTEAANVVIACYSGETPDLAALTEAKSKLI
ncbi:MAG: hypothetical protein M0R51_09270 [Clostridia bacterium]|jgi:uncharacterized protein YxeA|nr:hypothetical protein [Clostridia bacterium]